MEKIINSILENDLYKFSMSYYYQVMYPEGIGTFTFKDRNNLVFDKNFITVLKSEFNKLNNLSLTDEECEWAITNISYNRNLISYPNSRYPIFFNISKCFFIIIDCGNIRRNSHIG